VDFGKGEGFPMTTTTPNKQKKTKLGSFSGAGKFE